jgi:hypothetical protein
MGSITPGRHQATGSVGTKGDIRMGQKIEDGFGAMRLVQPEQKAALRRVNADEGLVGRPVVDEIDFDEN